MDYQELAAKQRGFLLSSQLSDREFSDAIRTGFICSPPGMQWHFHHGRSNEIPCASTKYMQYAYCTKLVGGHIADGIYLDWLVAFPTIPPEHRHPTPYVCGTKALKARGFDTGRCAVADIIMTPPGLLPYIDETSLCDYIINEHITPDDWELVDNIPVENPLPAMRKFHEDGDDRIDAIDMAYQAYTAGIPGKTLPGPLNPPKIYGLMTILAPSLLTAKSFSIFSLPSVPRMPLVRPTMMTTGDKPPPEGVDKPS